MSCLSTVIENSLKDCLNCFLNRFLESSLVFDVALPTNVILFFSLRFASLLFKTTTMLVFNFLLIQVKTCTLPTLPRHRELASELGPVYAKLANKSSIAKKQPVYRCSESQVIIDFCILADLAVYIFLFPCFLLLTQDADVTSICRLNTLPSF